MRQGFAKTNLKFTKTVIWRDSIATYQDNYKIQNKIITAKTNLEFTDHKT